MLGESGDRTEISGAPGRMPKIRCWMAPSESDVARLWAFLSPRKCAVSRSAPADPIKQRTPRTIRPAPTHRAPDQENRLQTPDANKAATASAATSTRLISVMRPAARLSRFAGL
jgi:hypothetical protein